MSPDAAKRLYKQALSIFKEVVGERHPDYASSLNNLAAMLRAQGDYAAAKPLCEQALAIRKAVMGERHPDYANSLSNLELELFARHGFGGAAPRFEQALEIGLTIRPLANVPAGHAYRHVLTSKGAVLECQRHLGLLRRLEQANPNSENARLFVRLEQKSAGLATLALGTPDPSQADAWRAQVAELTREKEDIETKLAGKDATFRAAQAEARRRPEEVQAALPTGTALIDLLKFTHFTSPAEGKGEFKFETRLLSFVVRPDRPIVRNDLGPRAPIAEAVASWRVLLRKPAAALDGQVRELRKLVWEPLEPHLVGVTTVLVSPDGVLGSVPLAALPAHPAIFLGGVRAQHRPAVRRTPICRYPHFVQPLPFANSHISGRTSIRRSPRFWQARPCSCRTGALTLNRPVCIVRTWNAHEPQFPRRGSASWRPPTGCSMRTGSGSSVSTA